MADRPPATLQRQVAQQRVEALRATLTGRSSSPSSSSQSSAARTPLPLQFHQAPASATHSLPPVRQVSTPLQLQRPIAPLTPLTAPRRRDLLPPPTSPLPAVAQRLVFDGHMTSSSSPLTPSTPSTSTTLPPAASTPQAPSSSRRLPTTTQPLTEQLYVHESSQPSLGTSLQHREDTARYRDAAEVVQISTIRMLREEFETRGAEMRRQYVDYLDEQSFLMRYVLPPGTRRVAVAVQ